MSKSEHELRLLFIKHAKRFDKKHGNWLLFDFEDGSFLSMDSWNGKFCLQIGEPNYNYWRGFENEMFYDFGLNEEWARNKKSNYDDDVYEFYINKISKKYKDLLP